MEKYDKSGGLEANFPVIGWKGIGRLHQDVSLTRFLILSVCANNQSSAEDLATEKNTCFRNRLTGERYFPAKVVRQRFLVELAAKQKEIEKGCKQAKEKRKRE